MQREKVKSMCLQPMDNKAYFRPFICKGELSKVRIFLAGINPATPIYPKDIDVEEYVDMLLNYDKFMSFYNKARLGRGKDEISRTRVGMESFIGWLKSFKNVGVLETDVIAYPTENLKFLKKEPKEIIERGKEIFFELVMEFQPELIIFHGKKAIVHAYDVLVKKGLSKHNLVNMEMAIEDMEKQSPLFEFRYPNGISCSVMACRHFMY